MALRRLKMGFIQYTLNNWLIKKSGILGYLIKSYRHYKKSIEPKQEKRRLERLKRLTIIEQQKTRIAKSRALQRKAMAYPISKALEFEHFFLRWAGIRPKRSR